MRDSDTEAVVGFYRVVEGEYFPTGEMYDPRFIMEQREKV